MSTNSRFLKFTSVCCAITVITTLGIHVFFPEPPADPEKRLLLYKDAVYIANRWWITFHCLMVIVSMWGFYLLQQQKSMGLAGLGCLFCAVVGIAETTRQQFVLFYMNGLREQYAALTDAGQKEIIKNLLAYAGVLGSPLYGVFALAFGLGNLCFGISLAGERGFSEIISLLLIIWSVMSFVQLGNSFWHIETIDKAVHTLSFTFQPAMRALLAIWIWKKAGTIFNTVVS